MASPPRKLDADYRHDETNPSSWTPADFQRFTDASLLYQLAFEEGHDADGEHVRDPLVPIAAGFFTFNAGTGDWDEVWSRGGIAFHQSTGTGIVEMEIDPALNTTEYAVVVWPVKPPHSAQPVIAFRTWHHFGGRSPSTSLFEFQMVNAGGAHVNVPFLVHVYGER